MNDIKILILFIIIVLIFILKYLEPLFLKYKINNNSEHGSARFSSLQEIKCNYVKEQINDINEVGFPIYFDKQIKNVWMDMETPHWVYLGSTGSGKSVTQVIPFCSFIASAKNKRSAFITDPKGEIFNTTSKMFKDNGYNVLTIDFRNPEKSNKINILEPIIKEYEKYIEYENLSKKEKDKLLKVEFNNISMEAYAETNRLISSLSDMIMKDKNSKDPFWETSARQLLEGLIGFFLEEYKHKKIKREQITMTSIRKFQNSSMDESNFKKFVAYLKEKKYGSKSKDSLTSIISASENTYKSITSVWSSKMSIFDDINVANVTSVSDFDFDLLGKEPTVVYVIVPDEDKTYFTLVTIIVGLLYRELVKLANIQNNKKLPVQIDWLLDEFANCPPLADIEAIVSVARSRGMRFHFFIQSFAQLDNVYGKEVAQIILDNCGLAYLKTNTQDTAEAISKRLGKKTIESNSISQSMSFEKNDGSKSVSLMGRDLMTADEIKQLHYKMIIFPIKGYPIIRNTILYKKFECYKDGNIERTIDSLKDLSKTYFTVEDIKDDKRLNVETRNKKEKAFIKEEKNNANAKFGMIKQFLLNLDPDAKFSFQEENMKIYMRVNLSKNISNKMRIELISKYKENYHFEIDGNQINIHTKGIF